jgi:hypothetical protein
MNNILYLVHCVDTEGPLYESLEATFERIEKAFGLHFEPSENQLQRLQQGRDLPNELKKVVMDFLCPSRLKYNSNWEQLDSMINDMMGEKWRMRYSDDFGRPYTFSWYMLDHVGYSDNPRRRTIGYHALYDYYYSKLKHYGVENDSIYWHHHPPSLYREAHKLSNNFSYYNEHLVVLSRRIIDRLHFPASFRPGNHLERPDINFFLEQWIPFDYGNQGMQERPEDSAQKDMGKGRGGDWRGATSEWESYHPDFYDYQKKGAMKRYIARCLNLDARLRPITEEEIEKAFDRATRKATILSVTSHDEREMRDPINWFMQTIRGVQKRYPSVKLSHQNAVDALRLCENIKAENPTQLSFDWQGSTLHIQANKEIWGPQPFFCFKTRNRQYVFENLDFQGELQWSFSFDEDTLNIDEVDAIGIATNDNYGNSSVYRILPHTSKDKLEVAFLNTNAPRWMPN